MRSDFSRRLGIWTALTAVAFLCLGAGTAMAQTEVEYDPDVNETEIEITGEINVDLITMSLAGNTVTITDTGTGGIVRDPVSGLDCTNVNATTVTCPFDPAGADVPLNSIDAELDAANDSFASSLAVEVFVDGDDGNDTITGGSVDDSLNGGDGNDVLNGGDGDDFLDDGGQGFQAGGNDVVIGGNGFDEADTFRSVPVVVTIDGIANDGAPSLGEADNVQTEQFEGGSQADTLIGDAGPNAINSYEGNDVLLGMDGPDSLRGGMGDDQMDGGLGPDDMACGSGLDTAPLGPGDYITGGFANAICERTGAEIASESATVKGKGKKAKAKVRVSCALEETLPCAGKVVLMSNGKKLTKQGKFNVAAGQTKNAKLKLTKKGGKKLRKAGGALLVTAEARTTYPIGAGSAIGVKDEALQLLGK
jgi:hypothetical protein